MSAQKRKGTAWEVAVRDYFKSRGVNAYRPAQEGWRDTGDIHGVEPFTIQCKDWRDVAGALREGVDGARRQAEHAGNPFGVAVVKRARKPVQEGYVVMRLEDFATLVPHLRWLADE